MTHRFYRFVPVAVVLLVAMGVTLAATQVSGQTKTLVNADANGVGLHGYDPVAYFTDGKAVKGDSQYHSKYDGAAYYFQSGDDKAAFDKEPERYVPQYGGYCAMAMTMGKLEDADPNYFLVYEGKLFLQRNEKAHMMFSNDPEGNRKKADENWSKLQSQQDN
jgi:YHS domain-containing protein